MNLLIFILGIAIGIFLYRIVSNSNFDSYEPYDPTDDIQNSERSGLLYFKDYGTGIEYISNPNGGPLLMREKGENETRT
ncbi:MAG: hypothetical protein CL674_14370 [Bdellovibrionaceae bacterium]|jgi:hypothetical protein|nr:hypothetical protein [Pseudobdellovibrionaceae bacterium]MAF92452.1 hypothetical protein [Pseudobdellovibrionaceae bacterium]QDP47595.1 MAG: hypothetical protein GOVbin1174_43 [Prokaryotic dsDNA virus sp.]|tara:strand:+ start:3052 stop:3288 length:237 start_codon:yes stop_codon:yes gene_type:complete